MERYFSDREHKPPRPTRTDLSPAAWKGIAAAIRTRVSDGSFAAAYPHAVEPSARRLVEQVAKPQTYEDPASGGNEQKQRVPLAAHECPRESSHPLVLPLASASQHSASPDAATGCRAGARPRVHPDGPHTMRAARPRRAPLTRSHRARRRARARARLTLREAEPTWPPTWRARTFALSRRRGRGAPRSRREPHAAVRRWAETHRARAPTASRCGRRAPR